jgi:hypothetical protein
MNCEFVIFDSLPERFTKVQVPVFEQNVMEFTSNRRTKECLLISMTY